MNNVGKDIILTLNSEELWVTLLMGAWWRENENKLVEWKALVDTVGIKSADWKMTRVDPLWKKIKQEFI